MSFCDRSFALFEYYAARVILGLLVWAGGGCMADAHQVPSLTVEALFAKDRTYTLRVNLDPRLIISDQPASLPPVPVEWYRDQSADALAATKDKAAAYLAKALSVKFGVGTTGIGKCEFQPMDGATNMPLSSDSKEIHLLAEAKGNVPEEEDSFSLSLSHDANVSMILMNSFEGTLERRPNVVFPGETSRPFKMVFPVKQVASGEVPAGSDSHLPEGEPSESATRGYNRAMIGAAIALAALIGATLWRWRTKG